MKRCAISIPAQLSMTLPSVFPYQLGLAQNVTFHRLFQLIFAGSSLQIELDIQRVEFEKITVRRTRRRARATIACLAKTAAALQRAIGELLLLLHSFGEFFRTCRKVV